MSPWTQIVIGEQTRRTAAIEKGGLNPDWTGEILEFSIEDETSMHISVFDGEETLIGDATYQMNHVLRGKVTQKPVQINYQGKMVGTVYLEFKYKGPIPTALEGKTLSNASTLHVNSELDKALALAANPVAAAAPV